MVVVDTSAIVAVLRADPPVPDLDARLSGSSLHAPYLIDVEFLHVIRRLLGWGRLSLTDADRARAEFAALVIVRHPHRPLMERMWELRDNLTAYDAAFVALSEVLDIPLVTTDARLAAAPGNRAVIEIY